MRFFGCFLWASLVAQLVKNLPSMWETWVQSLGWEDPLEKGKITHSCILAREFRILGGKELDMTERLSLTFFSVQVLFLPVNALELSLYGYC